MTRTVTTINVRNVPHRSYKCNAPMQVGLAIENNIIVRARTNGVVRRHTYTHTHTNTTTASREQSCSLSSSNLSRNRRIRANFYPRNERRRQRRKRAIPRRSLTQIRNRLRVEQRAVARSGQWRIRVCLLWWRTPDGRREWPTSRARDQNTRDVQR